MIIWRQDKEKEVANMNKLTTVAMVLVVIFIVGLMAMVQYDNKAIKQAIYKHTGGQMICMSVPSNYKEILASREYVKAVYK